MDDTPERALAALEKYGGWYGVLRALDDAERYRHLFDCPEPFCYRGEVYDTKAEADAAIDSAVRE